MITTKGLSWLWRQAKKLYNRGRRIVKPTPDLRDEAIEEAARGAVVELGTKIGAGEMRTSRWVLDMRKEIRRSYISQYLLAKGGRQNMTQADWGRLGGLLKKQYSYLRQFETEIKLGKLTPGQIKARSQLYIESARQAFERGKVAALGMPSLPAYPGDGNSICGVRCKCNWSIRETKDEWLARWKLNPAEHCDTCLERSVKWNPYVVPKTFTRR